MKRKGIATQLLERVCKDAADEGYDCVEAYPNKVYVNEFDGFMGPLELYEKMGFVMYNEHIGKYKECFIMRKTLG